jgi:hypothetical protein
VSMYRLDLTELLSLTRAVPVGTPHNNNVGCDNGPHLITKIS